MATIYHTPKQTFIEHQPPNNLGQQQCIARTSPGWYDLWGKNHSSPNENEH